MGFWWNNINNFTDTQSKVRKQVPKKNKMQRSPSSADISTYDGCGDASKKLQMIANFFFLTASLVLIGVGKQNWFYIRVFFNVGNVNISFLW